MEERKFETLLGFIEQKQYHQLRAALADMNEVDVAQFIEEELPEEKQPVVFRMLPKEMAADVFSELSGEVQENLVVASTDKELSFIVEDLYVDDAVDMLEELPANVVKRVLKNATPATRSLINQFLQYPENSAGSVMTAEFTDLRKDMTVADAIDHIRRTGEDRETVYTCYVLGERRVLEGVVSVKDLLLNSDDRRIADIMDDDVISVVTTDDREEAARLFSKYNLLSLPVVDKEKRLVGIVTVDDAVDVMEEEATEDFEKMAAMHPSERPYLKTGVFTLAKNRIGWLLVLMISAMITGGILEGFEAAIATMPLLVSFIPMLTDTGGNAGSQSATMVIRGMALGEISTSDLLRILWKEVRVALLVGVALAGVNYIRLILTYPGQEMVALTVSISVLLTVILAKAVGGVLPILAKICHFDPAIMASPLITTIVDAFALVIYFNIAKALIAF